MPFGNKILWYLYTLSIINNSGYLDEHETFRGAYWCYQNAANRKSINDLGYI